MNETIIEDNTIMPDGRPFFAWNNELKMLRKSEQDLETQRKELKRQWEVLRIVEIETRPEVETDDMLIRIRRNKLVTVPPNYSFVDLYEVEDLKGTKHE